MSIEYLPPEAMTELEAEGSWLFHGSPTPPEDFDLVEMPDGSFEPALRPVLPTSFNWATKTFTAHDTEPVVCATKYAESAVFRGLCHPILARRLGIDRRYGRNGSDDNTDSLSMRATARLRDAIIEAGPDHEAYVAAIKREVPPFQPCNRDGAGGGEFRSRQPALPVYWFKVNGLHFPSAVQIVEPYDEIATA